MHNVCGVEGFYVCSLNGETGLSSGKCGNCVILMANSQTQREEVGAFWSRSGLLLLAVLFPLGLLGTLDERNLIKPQQPQERCSYFPPFYR